MATVVLLKMALAVALILTAQAKEVTTTVCENCKSEGSIEENPTKDKWLQADFGKTLGLAQEMKEDKPTTTVCENCKSDTLVQVDLGKTLGLAQEMKEEKPTTTVCENCKSDTLVHADLGKTLGLAQEMKEDKPTTTVCENCKSDTLVQADLGKTLGLAQEMKEEKPTTTVCENCKSGPEILIQDGNIGESLGLNEKKEVNLMVEQEGTKMSWAWAASTTPWLGLGLLMALAAMATMYARQMWWRSVEAFPVNSEERTSMLEMVRRGGEETNISEMA